MRSAEFGDSELEPSLARERMAGGHLKKVAPATRPVIADFCNKICQEPTYARAANGSSIRSLSGLRGAVQ